MTRELPRFRLVGRRRPHTTAQSMTGVGVVATGMRQLRGPYLAAGAANGVLLPFVVPILASRGFSPESIGLLLSLAGDWRSLSWELQSRLSTYCRQRSRRCSTRLPCMHLARSATGTAAYGCC